MNYRFKKADDLFEKTGKSLFELVEALQEIDENDPTSLPNETSITGENGEKIILSVETTDQNIRYIVTRDGLKLELNIPRD